jgi:6,7-dimethyl-8-ribityllumazine synthase
MSSKDARKDLSKIPAFLNAEKTKIGIVVSEWYEDINEKLLNGCKSALFEAGLSEDQIIIEHVPGTFELPVGAKMLLQKYPLDAVICIGCVIKGETKHDEYIANSVSQGLINLGIMSGKAVVFGVLTPNNMEQALERSGGKYGNKGEEAGITAVKMVNLAYKLKNSQQKIGF